MGHLRACRVAADGKRLGNKANRTAGTFAIYRRLIFAVVTLFAASVSGSASYAQSGPFAGMAGTRAGGGTATLAAGSRERISSLPTSTRGAGGRAPDP